MFDEIVESVLNEISANDAYAKFYNKLPYEDFKRLTDSYGKFDNLMKFILKTVIENNNDFNIAFEFIEKYKNLPNEIRIELLNNFKQGKYTDLFDMNDDVDSMLKDGVNTAKLFQKDGLVILYEDDNYLLTCTLTYEANCHYYGHTKWCTASDRFGQYDGWIMFLRYTHGDFYEYECGDYDDFYSRITEDSIPEDVLFQFVDKLKNETYQFMFTNESCIECVCDINDKSVSQIVFKEQMIPKNLLELVVNNIDLLLEKEEKLYKKEFKYQTSKDYQITAKKYRLIKKNIPLFKQYIDECNKRMLKKKDFVNKKYNELLESNLLSNTEFLKQLLTNSEQIQDNIYSTDFNAEKCENLLKENFYCTLLERGNISSDTTLYILAPVLGKFDELSFSISCLSDLIDVVLCVDDGRKKDLSSFKLEDMDLISSEIINDLAQTPHFEPGFLAYVNEYNLIDAFNNGYYYEYGNKTYNITDKLTSIKIRQNNEDMEILEIKTI